MMRKLAKSARHKAAIAVKHLHYSLSRPVVPDRFVHRAVPYYSQWESPELNRQILIHEIRAEDDPNWRMSGAKSRAEYALWSWNGCGMACLKMLLAHATGQTIPLVELGKRCTAYGGYRMPLDDTVGLYYQPFAAFVTQEFGLRVTVMPVMTQQDIIRSLMRRGYAMVSVSPAIRGAPAKPRAKGGHLVLMVGYDLPKQVFYFHNPSGTSPKTQSYAEVSFKDFRKFFSGRGIVLTQPSG